MTDLGFDKFAAGYTETLDPCLKFSGESSDYFVQYKLRCLLDCVLDQGAHLEILDFGCGVGKLASLVAGAVPGSVVHGYDVSDRSVEAARREFSAVENLFFHASLPPATQYDLIYAANVFHHVKPEERPQVLLDLKQSLKSGGRIVIFEHNPWNPLTLHLFYTCPFDKDAKLVFRFELVKMAARIGLKVVLRRYIVFFPHFLRGLRRFESKLGSVPLGAQYMLVLSL
ncbi:MAG: class I SAM-dependent methyltransferase [Desulfomonile tiedjei]|nr:class I SAM-dependent methyltransferase [Desulfomonile tiedjei]